MTGYTDVMDDLASSADRRIQALYARLVAGEITVEQFLTLASAIVAQDQSRAVGMADVALAATLTVSGGTARTPVGLLPEVDRELIVERLRVALADPDPVAALRVEVRDVVLETAQIAYGVAMQRQGVKRWTRALNAGACVLCRDLAGDVLPAYARMYRHKGCGCSQRPILDFERRIS